MAWERSPAFVAEIAEIVRRAGGRVRVFMDIEGEELMPFTNEQIADIFTFHDQPEAVPHYEAIRAKARELAEVILAHTPTCPDQSAAIRKLRETVMTANAAIALRGQF